MTVSGASRSIQQADVRFGDRILRDKARDSDMRHKHMQQSPSPAACHAQQQADSQVKPEADRHRAVQRPLTLDTLCEPVTT